MKFTHLHSIVSFFICFGVLSAQAGGVGVLRFEDCVRIALENSPRLDAQHARLQSARHAARQEARWSDPEFEAVLLSGERDVALIIEPDFAGVRRAAGRAGEAKAGIVAAEIHSVRWELAAEIVQLFHRTRAAAERLAALDRELAWRRELHEIRVREVELGAYEASALAELRVLLAGMEKERIKTNLDLALSKSSMNLLLGRGPTSPLELAASPSTNALPGLGQFLAATANNAPSLAVASAVLEAAARRIELATREGLPKVSLGPAMKETQGDFEPGGVIKISLPIWNGNREGRLGAKQERIAAAADLEKISRETTSLAHAIWASAVAARDELVAFQTRSPGDRTARVTQAMKAAEAGDLSRREALDIAILASTLERELAALRFHRDETAAMVQLWSRPPSAIAKPTKR